MKLYRCNAFTSRQLIAILDYLNSKKKITREQDN